MSKFSETELGMTLGEMKANQTTIFKKIDEVKDDVKVLQNTMHNTELTQQKRYDELKNDINGTDSKIDNHIESPHCIEGGPTFKDKVMDHKGKVAVGGGGLIIAIIYLIIELINKGGI